MPLYRLPSSIKLDKKITANHRFTTYRGRLDREPVFIKVAARDETLDNLAGELFGLRLFNELLQAHPGGPFTVPDLLAFGKNYVITTFIEGAPARAIYPNIELLVRTFAWIDKATFVPSGGVTRFSLSTQHGANQAERQAARLKVTPYKSYFDGELINQALETFADGLPALVPRFTHADLSHQHILLPFDDDPNPDAKPSLIDFESCSWLWPRFYDAVNYALRFLYRFPYDNEFANTFMDKYLSAIGETYTKHKTEIQTLVLCRALSAIHEHLGPIDVHNNSEKIMDKDMADILSDIIKRTLKGKNVFEG